MVIQFLNTFLSLAYFLIFHFPLEVETLEKKISPIVGMASYI